MGFLALKTDGFGFDTETDAVCVVLTECQPVGWSSPSCCGAKKPPRTAFRASTCRGTKEPSWRAPTMDRFAFGRLTQTLWRYFAHAFIRSCLSVWSNLANFSFCRWPHAVFSLDILPQFCVFPKLAFLWRAIFLLVLQNAGKQKYSWIWIVQYICYQPKFNNTIHELCIFSARWPLGI